MVITCFFFCTLLAKHFYFYAQKIWHCKLTAMGIVMHLAATLFRLRGSAVSAAKFALPHDVHFFFRSVGKLPIRYAHPIAHFPLSVIATPSAPLPSRAHCPMPPKYSAASASGRCDG